MKLDDLASQSFAKLVIWTVKHFLRFVKCVIQISAFRSQMMQHIQASDPDHPLCEEIDLDDLLPASGSHIINAQSFVCLPPSSMTKNVLPPSIGF